MTTALRDAIDYTTLGWVKPELDETLRQARIEIEAFAEDPADTSRMRFCAGYLHPAHGRALCPGDGRRGDGAPRPRAAGRPRRRTRRGLRHADARRRPVARLP